MIKQLQWTWFESPKKHELEPLGPDARAEAIDHRARIIFNSQRTYCNLFRLLVFQLARGLRSLNGAARTGTRVLPV